MPLNLLYECQRGLLITWVYVNLVNCSLNTKNFYNFYIKKLINKRNKKKLLKKS